MNQGPSEQWWRRDIVGESGYQGAIPAGEPKVQDSTLPFWALMSFTLVLLIAPQTYLPSLAPLRLALLTAAVSIAAYLFDRVFRQRPIMRWTREMWITAGLVGWAVLTIPFSYWPGGSARFLFDFYFKTLAIFWILSNVVNTRTRLRQVAWALSLMAVPLALTGINQYRLGNFMASGSVTRIIGYEAPLTGNPNDLALMLNLILPLTLALFLSRAKGTPRSVLLGIIGLLVFGVIATFSRAGFVTLAAIFTMYLWRLRNRPERKWAVSALVIALLCLPLLPSGYLGRLATITNVEADETGSAEARWDDMVAAVRFIGRTPIVGAGLGMATLGLNEERGALWQIVHNVYLQYAVDLGIPGLVLFLLLLFGCIKSATFVQRRSAGVSTLRELFFLAEGIEVSLIAFAVAAFFYPVAYHFYSYYIGGLALAIKAIYELEERNARSWLRRNVSS